MTSRSTCGGTVLIHYTVGKWFAARNVYFGEKSMNKLQPAVISTRTLHAVMNIGRKRCTHCRVLVEGRCLYLR